MSIKPAQQYKIPELTVKVAKAAFPKGDNIYMKMRDECGVIYTDEEFADLFARRGKPAEAPGRLAQVTIMQYEEGLTDREAADAVRGRIDWKYALGLELEDDGFHYSVLSKFRQRLLAGGAEGRLLEQMLVVLQEKQLLRARGKQRTDSTHIFGAIRILNRLELVGETLRQALNCLASVVPTWLQQQVPAVWYERYGEPISSYRLPKKKEEQAELAQVMGADGLQLLGMLYQDEKRQWLHEAPALQILRQVWYQQYCYGEDGAFRWRTDKELPPTKRRIVSPYDIEARGGKKRDTCWQGYKVHLTETCDPDAPKLITHVETRIACEQDAMATADIHQSLAEKQLLPSQHVVDTAYVSGPQLVASREKYDIDLLGPVLPDTSWQAREEGAFDLTHFKIDWEQQVVTCPGHKQSSYWREGVDRHDKPVIDVRFSRKDCGPCADRSRCTQTKAHGRGITLRPQLEHEAIQARRQYQQTNAFQAEYAVRAGAEGAISQAAYSLGLRRARYRGLPKTHLQNLATAAAMNLKRTAGWLLGIPSATTPISRFAALALA
jgi:transposase